jgi:hypothetical protein
MGKIKNRSRGEVFVPGFGKGAYLKFGIEAQEQVETRYESPEWLGKLVTDLAQPSIKAVRHCIEVAGRDLVRDADGSIDFSGIGSEGADVNAVAEAIFDALFLAVFGKTYDEKVAEEEQQQEESLRKRLQQVEENPLLASAFLREYGLAPTAPVSDLMKSDASPQ